MKSSEKNWTSLTWSDLDAWAGSRSISRGKAYQRQGRVRDLVISAEGRLLATVMGGARYAVSIWLTMGDTTDHSLESNCTCPVGDRCKHAVAVVAEYLERLGDKAEVPEADPKDTRWAKLSEDASDSEIDEEGEIEEDEDETGVPPAPRKTRSGWDQKIRAHIDAKSREELVDLVWSLTERFPEIRDELRERIALGEGDVDRLVKEARKELQRVTSEIGWQNHWDGQGHTPDFSKLKHRLERLLELGHPDAVVQLGREIIKRGIEQVEQSHDEGETASEIAECLPIVFRAVAASSLSPAKRLLFAIDAYLQDDYDIIGDTASCVMDEKYQPADWITVADELSRRLTSMPKGTGDDFHHKYERDRVSRWLADALNNAGRNDDVLALYEKEARTTGSYERLVTLLIDQKRYEDAQRWALEGIEKTCEKLPGIASNLAQALCDVARSQKKWDIVAAHAAWRFLHSPTVDSFKELVSVGTKAQCKDEVRGLALRYLETGVSPVVSAACEEGGNRDLALGREWPLPIPDFLLPLLKPSVRMRSVPGPLYDVLINMAIADKRPDDVLKWYDKMCADRKQTTTRFAWYGHSTYADQVAEAVAKTHPQRSADIYRQRITDNLGNASISAYESVAGYLKKLSPLLQSLGREQEWTQTLADIRLRHKNRPRFMEILDKMEGRPILQTRRGK